MKQLLMTTELCLVQTVPAMTSEFRLGVKHDPLRGEYGAWLNGPESLPCAVRAHDP